MAHIPGFPETDPYTAGVPRALSKPRPSQGARLAALRRDAGLTQTELARLVGEPQQNIALWEQSNKPPRSDAIPKLAKALGVSVEDLFTDKVRPARRAGPVGKVRKLFDEVAKLPRRQQEKIVEFLTPIVEDYKRRTG
jgi:transcriptional regulator with XRE-family HTH domain